MTNSISRYLSATSTITALKATRCRRKMLLIASISHRAVCPMWRTSTKTTRSMSMSVTSNIRYLSDLKTWKWVATSSLISRMLCSAHVMAKTSM